MSETQAVDTDKIWLKRIRNFIGILGIILPWVSLVGAILVDRAGSLDEYFWYNLSISATYYVTPPLVGILTTAAVVLMCYKGHDLTDHIITSISGVFGILIVIFPCYCSAATQIVGFFQLPVGISHTVHCISAVAFFLLLSYMSMFQFTKHKKKDDGTGDEPLSKNKRIKNIIFRVCAVGMICALILVLPCFKEIPAHTFIGETVALTFFGISWLVKGEFLGFLAD